MQLNLVFYLLRKTVCLTWVNADSEWEAQPVASGSFTAGGDLTGTSTNQTVESIQGIVISGTPAIGNTLIATSTSAASWSAPTVISGITVSGTPSVNFVLTATSSSAADWQAIPSGFTAGGDLLELQPIKK